jgi:hypothetical protein
VMPPLRSTAPPPSPPKAPSAIATTKSSTARGRGGGAPLLLLLLLLPPRRLSTTGRGLFPAPRQLSSRLLIAKIRTRGASSPGRFAPHTPSSCRFAKRSLGQTLQRNKYKLCYTLLQPL